MSQWEAVLGPGRQFWGNGRQFLVNGRQFLGPGGSFESTGDSCGVTRGFLSTVTKTYTKSNPRCHH